MDTFKPKVGDRIEISGKNYQFQSLPNFPRRLHASETVRSKVYKLKKQDSTSQFALKVFKSASYREERLVDSTNIVSQYQDFEGIKEVTNRICLTYANNG